MNAVPQPHKPRMTADEFIAWAAETGFRGELVGGQVVGMASERAEHARVKFRVAKTLEAAVAARRLPCEVFPDGMAVQIAADTVHEPDALLRCGDPIPGSATKVVDPMIVVEVLSPSTAALDAGGKLEGYFQLPSLRHYLILRVDTRALIHHARAAADGPIATAILREGTLTLDPPGIVLDVPALFGPPERPTADTP